MIYLFVAFLIVTIALVFLEDYVQPYHRYIYAGLCVGLILMAGLRPMGLDPDSLTYEKMFLQLDNEALALQVEYSFIAISKALRLITDDVRIVFLFYAILGISLKLWAIRRLTPWYFLPIAIYFGNYFILHDFIQIRVGVSSALLLMALKPLSENRKWAAAAYITCAVFFHYSALILYLLLLFSNKPLSKAWKIGLSLILPTGILLFLLRIDFLTFIPIPYFQNKVEVYRKLADIGIFDAVSLLSPFMWLKAFVLLYLLFFYDTVYKHCPQLPILLKAQGLALFFFFAFSSIPVFSGRIFELFGIVEIILFPYLFYTILPRKASLAIVCGIGVIEFVFTIFIWKLLDFWPYS